jgi:hypothetical protein
MKNKYTNIVFIGLKNKGTIFAAQAKLLENQFVIT